MKRNLLYIASALAVTATLTACGGGGSDGPFGGTEIKPGSNVIFSQTPAPSMQVKAGTVFDLKATVNSYQSKLTALSWSVIPQKAALPELSLTNADCSASSRTTNSLNSDQSASRWACTSSGVTPLVNAPSNYKIVVKGADSAGNAATHETLLTVTPLTETDLATLRPTVAGPTQIIGQAGGKANAVCFGKEQSGGNGAVAYKWTLVSNPTGRVFSIEDATQPSAVFNLPQLGVTDKDVEAVARCTVTDSNGFTNSVDTLVRATAVFTEPPIVAAADTILANVGQAVPLTCKGAGGFIANADSALSYQWVVKANPDKLGVLLSSSNASTMTSLVSALPLGKLSSDVIFQCRVTDDALRTATVDVKVTYVVNAATLGSIQANAGQSKVVASGALVNLDASASTVVGGTGTPALFYRWTQVAGPNVTISSANSAKASFIAPTVDEAPVPLKFQVVVTTAPQAADYLPQPNEVATVEVLVGGFVPPTLTVNYSVSADAGNTVEITASTSGQGESTVFYRWTQIDGASVELDGQSTATVTFTAPGTSGLITLRVEASLDPAFPALSTASSDVVVNVKAY